MKILYIGSFGPLSLIPLKSLLDSRWPVCAVAMRAESPGPDPVLPVINATDATVGSTARLNDVPLVCLSADLSRHVDELRCFAPDVILVSCFSLRLPDEIISLPRIGCFNLHPSLLPAYRGPVPLFWQFHDGTNRFGVTLHHMNSRFDEGDIVSQTVVEIPDGVSRYRASILLAEAGSNLLEQCLHDFERGVVNAFAQDGREASYQGVPSEPDFAVSTAWPARRMYNFICAMRRPGRIFPCEAGGRTWHLVGADAWQQCADAGLRVEGRRVIIPCSDGFVRARFQAS